MGSIGLPFFRRHEQMIGDCYTADIKKFTEIVKW